VTITDCYCPFYFRDPCTATEYIPHQRKGCDCAITAKGEEVGGPTRQRTIEPRGRRECARDPGEREHDFEVLKGSRRKGDVPVAARHAVDDRHVTGPAQ
jgi:hypothetical protein